MNTHSLEHVGVTNNGSPGKRDVPNWWRIAVRNECAAGIEVGAILFSLHKIAMLPPVVRDDGHCPFSLIMSVDFDRVFGDGDGSVEQKNQTKKNKSNQKLHDRFNEQSYQFTKKYYSNYKRISKHPNPKFAKQNHVPQKLECLLDKPPDKELFDGYMADFQKRIDSLKHGYCSICKGVSINSKTTALQPICLTCKTRRYDEELMDTILPVWIDATGKNANKTLTVNRRTLLPFY